MNLKTDSILSPAETRVASGYVAGMIGKEIAGTIGVSHNTIVRQTQSIYDKTGIPHSTNALVAWFLSQNYDLDLAEFRRRVGAAFLCLLMCFQTVNTDFSTDFSRSGRTRRVEARRTSRRGRRKEDENTIDLTTI